mmetsp:Transcript_2104/g.4069  ORF Transcript_2104/g.4069 Transcript_2104/m.4069 type:complete len:316 (+) Transcript_2104:2024-2971(+)
MSLAAVVWETSNADWLRLTRSRGTRRRPDTPLFPAVEEAMEAFTLNCDADGESCATDRPLLNAKSSVESWSVGAASMFVLLGFLGCAAGRSCSLRLLEEKSTLSAVESGKPNPLLCWVIGLFIRLLPAISWDTLEPRPPLDRAKSAVDRSSGGFASTGLRAEGTSTDAAEELGKPKPLLACIYPEWPFDISKSGACISGVPPVVCSHMCFSSIPPPALACLGLAALDATGLNPKGSSSRPYSLLKASEPIVALPSSSPNPLESADVPKLPFDFPLSLVARSKSFRELRLKPSAGVRSSFAHSDPTSPAAADPQVE